MLRSYTGAVALAFTLAGTLSIASGCQTFVPSNATENPSHQAPREGAPRPLAVDAAGPCPNRPDRCLRGRWLDNGELAHIPSISGFHFEPGHQYRLEVVREGDPAHPRYRLYRMVQRSQ